MKKFIILGLCLYTISSICMAAEEAETYESYYQQLLQLCGEQYIGEMTYPESGLDSFAGKRLLADFESCNEDEIRISFDVGEDQSRTWVLSKQETSLEFKHHHLHEDGSHDEVSLYGGMNNEGGSALTQSFPADEYTAELIPEAATNVWTLSLSEDLSVMTYHLTRHNKPRFTAVLERQ